jgi:hypothetical protein
MVRLLRLLRFRFAGDQSGAATVEFVIIAPVFFAIVLSVFEAGWLMTKYMMLDRGLDLAVRDLRLGAINNPDHDNFKERVCEYSIIFSDCEDVVLIEMTPVEIGTDDFPTNDRTCIDRANPIDPLDWLDNFNSGGRWDRSTPAVMFVRACVIVEPLFPGNRLGLQLPQDATGGFQMATYSAFANEPN